MRNCDANTSLFNRAIQVNIGSVPRRTTLTLSKESHQYVYFQVVFSRGKTRAWKAPNTTLTDPTPSFNVSLPSSFSLREAHSGG